MTYSNSQTKFSNNGHNKLVEIKFYEKLFETNNLKIIDTTVTKPGYNKEAQMLDQKYGVDYRIIINHSKLGKISHTIQERFIAIKNKHFQMLTLRLKTKTGLPSEISKINADLMIYGYVNENNIDQIIVIYMSPVKIALSNGSLLWDSKINYDGSSFIRIKFSDLFKIGAVKTLINYF